MKKSDVHVGGTYLAKVGRHDAEVRIESENARGGWNAVSVATGKPVRVKDAKHLKPANAEGDAKGTAAAAAEPDAVPLTQLDREKKRPKGKRESKHAQATPSKAPAPKGEAKAMSCLDAAVAVLKAEGQPMACKGMVDAMKERGLWTTDAPTPAATLSSAILREMKKGSASRFQKVGRGLFALNTGAEG